MANVVTILYAGGVVGEHGVSLYLTYSSLINAYLSNNLKDAIAQLVKMLSVHGQSVRQLRLISVMVDELCSCIVSFLLLIPLSVCLHDCLIYSLPPSIFAIMYPAGVVHIKWFSRSHPKGQSSVQELWRVCLYPTLGQLVMSDYLVGGKSQSGLVAVSHFSSQKNGCPQTNGLSGYITLGTMMSKFSAFFIVLSYMYVTTLGPRGVIHLCVNPQMVLCMFA